MVRDTDSLRSTMQEAEAAWNSRHEGRSKMNFEIAFERLIGNERGYSNNPLDPGKETNWGISKRSYPDCGYYVIDARPSKANLPFRFLE